ncbi:MAG: ribosome maturation factor RimP [Clostridia bacterium]|nr:ribosome maturation factor RimP [Clostridia bacterium]
MAKIEETVTEIAEPIVEENGLELVDVEFVKEGSEWFLRIFIDKEEGVTLDDCEKVSRVLSDKLDEVDPITQAYHLEVSSPGIERPLKKTRDFERFLQHPIQVKTFVPVEGRKKFKGTLEDVTLETITVNIGGNSLIIPRDKISKANLLWEG